MSEHFPVATERTTRMFRELERDANPSRGGQRAEPTTDCGAYLKGRIVRHWLLADNADIHDVKKLWVLRQRRRK